MGRFARDLSVAGMYQDNTQVWQAILRPFGRLWCPYVGALSGRGISIVRAAIWVAGLSVVGTGLCRLQASEVRSPQVEKINEVIEQHWQDYGLQPSAEASDGKWCRRVFLDLIGRVPSYRELRDFVRDRDAGKREKLVDSLLEGESYRADFADHWGTIWSNILIGRSGGNDRRSFISREGMGKYLRDCFARNKPYNQMVYELISATGSTKPGTEGFNGATNFLIDKVNAEDATLATAATSRIFLGLQVQCTQCHNHPFNQWKQQKFWELNAFFRQTRALRRFVPGTRDISYAVLADEDFPGESGQPADAEIYFEERNGVSRVAFPVFVDGTEIERSGYLSEVNRRRELAKLVVQSEYLDKMMVNRMWAQFMGYAFTQPMDDLGPHTMVSHPQLLDYLSRELRESSYDMKALMRWIVLSRPYQLSSRSSARNESDDPSLGQPPQFSHFYMRQMSAEQLYQSLVQLGGPAEGSLEKQQQQRDRWLQQFTVAFGTDEGDEATTFNGSIPQALMLFNGDLVKRATSTEERSWLRQVATTGTKFSEKVNALFLAGLARRANVDEQKLGQLLLRRPETTQADALQDLWWAIINSNEFIMVH